MATQTRDPTAKTLEIGGWSDQDGGAIEVADFNDYPDASTDYGQCLTAYAALGFSISAFSVDSSSAISELRVLAYASCTSGTSGTMSMRIKVNGTWYTHGTGLSLPAGLTGDAFSRAWATNPATGLAWTVADINGSGSNPLEEIGVVAGAVSTNYPNLHSIRAEVEYWPITLYWVTYDSALAAPTGAQVRAGDDTNDAAADASGSEAAPTSTTEPFTFTAPITGLSGTGGFKTAVVWYNELLDEYSNVSVSGEWFLDGGGATYTLTADAGSYAVTGNAAALTIERALALDAGSYAVTERDAALTVSRTLSLDVGSFTFTGRDAALIVSRALSLDVGSYTFTGRDATLDYIESGEHPPINADAGAYTLTGHDAALSVQRALTADAGAYSVTGRDATLNVKRPPLTADAGAYSVIGRDATLTVARVLSLDAGAYTFTGRDAALSHVYALDADAGAYSLTGRDITTKRHYALACDAGHYTISGRDASLIYSGAPQEPQEPQTRGGGRSRFVEARKRLPMPFLIDWLTNEEPSAQTKRVIAEIKAGRPIPRDAKPPKGPENISATRLAVQILPSRAFVFKTYLADLVHASRTVEKAVALATERDDEDILMLL